MDGQIKNRGQISIFIIIGIAIIAFIALVFFYSSGLLPLIGSGKEINPNSFLQSCLEGKMRESMDLILVNGGYTQSNFYFKFKFDGENYQNISYLCYTENYYIQCINQEPMFITHLENEIKNYVNEDVQNCFENLVSELKKQDYIVDASYDRFDVGLSPKQANLDIKGKITYAKTEETLRQENFAVSMPTRLYELGIVSQEILNQEAEFCNFDYNGFMLLHPEFDIDKFRTGDSIMLYRIKDKKSNELIQFAVRSCVIPPGI
jgi:hypothetical protein